MIPTRLVQYYFDIPVNRRYPAAVLRTIWVELLICICIIGVLAAMATAIFQEYVQVAKVTHAALGALGSGSRTYISVYHAVNGNWPRDGHQAILFGNDFDDLMNDDFSEFAVSVKNGAIRNDSGDFTISIENGAMHVVMNKYLKGKIISLRPAVPKDNPLGPVAWFAASPLRPSDWTVAGQDKTTVDYSHINPRLR